MHIFQKIIVKKTSAYIIVNHTEDLAKLITAAQTGDERVVKRMMRSSTDDDPSSIEAAEFNRTAILIASANGRENVVKLLLDLGTSVNVGCPLGWTPLHFAAKEGHVSIIRLLLQRGANPGAKSNLHEDPPGTARHLTPLMLAAQNGITEIAKLILDSGGKSTINDQERNGACALIHAAINGNLELTKLLVENGADVDAEDQNGWNAMKWAIEKGHAEVMKFLRSKSTASENDRPTEG